VSEEVAAPTSNSEKQLAWEARHRTRAGIAALIGALGVLAYFALEQVVLRDIPVASGLDALTRAVQEGPVDRLPSLQVPAWEYYHDKQNLQLLRGVCGLLGFIGLGWAAGFLAVATRARNPGFRRWMIYLPIVGGVAYGVGALLNLVGRVMTINNLLDGPRTVQEATGSATGLNLYGGVLLAFAGLVLAVGLIFVSNHAMRVGLLTKLFGFLGIVSGAMLVLCTLPVFTAFWLSGLGMLFLGRWPGGDLPAWKTGDAEPWPVPERPQRRGGRVITEPSTPASPQANPGARRKRKKRQ
jgi:hypothetical protein